MKAHIDQLSTDTQDCDRANREFVGCADQARDNYRNEFKKGDDRKPDWQARKACNYVTESVENCANKLVGACKTQEEVDELKDKQLKVSLEQVKENIPNWDTDKCPAVKAHIDQLSTDTQDCDRANREFVGCADQARDNYRNEFKKGDDRKPDWKARKACNYVTESVVNCANKLVGACKTQEEV